MPNVIGWNENYLLVPARIFINLMANENAMKGDTSGLLCDTPGKNRIAEALGDLLPDAFAILREYSNSTYRGRHGTRDRLSNMVAKRASASLPGNDKNVLDDLRPELSSTISVVADSLFCNRPIYAEDIADAQEKIVCATHGSGPGVYLGVHPRNEDEGYIGEAIHVTKRQRGHSSSKWRVRRILPTLTKPGAKLLQDSLHHAIGPYNIHPDTKVTGEVRIRSGKPLLLVIDELLGLSHIKTIFRNELRLAEEAPEIILPEQVIKIQNWRRLQ